MKKGILKKPNDPKLEAIGGFLVLDVLALTCFGFAGYSGLLILRIIGACLALLLIPYYQYHLSISKKSKLPIFAIIAFLLLGFSYYWITFYSGAILYGILFNLVTTIGYCAFFLLGGSIRRMDKVKKDYIALAILGGLALLVLVTMIYSLARYGFFYAAIYKGQVYYYDGVVFPIASEGKILDGFMFREASLGYAKIPGFLLACSGVGLFSLKPSKDNWRFFALLGFALLGILDLLFAPYVMGLLLLIPVYLFVGIHRLLLYVFPNEEGAKKRKKIGKVIFIVLLALAAILVLTLLLDTFLGEDKSFLRKIPLFFTSEGNPRRLGAYIVDLEQTISATIFNVHGGVRSFNFVGLLFGANAINNGGLVLINTPIAEFAVFYQNGLLGFAGLLFLIFFGIYESWKFFEEGEEPLCRKLVYVGILLGGFLYFSLNNDELPLIHAYQLNEFFSYHSSSAVFFTRSSYLLLFIFLLGYIYTPSKLEVKEEAKVEVKEEDKKEVTCNE